MKLSCEEIIKIIQQEGWNKGFLVKIRPSASSSSVYLKIRSGRTEMLLRISDHPSKANICTVRFDKPQTKQDIINFVNNRLADISRRSFKHFMGM